MNGERLCDLLKHTGYTTGPEFSASALDWMFDNSRVANLFDWICSEVDERNVISEEEISRFACKLFKRKTMNWPTCTIF